MVLGVADCSFRTCLDAFRAEKAPAEVEPEAIFVAGNGVGGARQGAGLASIRTPRLVQHGQAAEAVGERWHIARRIGDRPTALPETLLDNREHDVSFG